ncbi:MAG: DUF2141 domain-containing protein [Bacteroidota bacterium]
MSSKKHAGILILFFLGIHLGFSQSGTISITVKGISPSKGGNVSAGVFVKGNFPKDGQQFSGQVVAAASEQVTLTFDSIPVGEYGIAVYQDIDRNGKLKTNLVGLPTEPIGFSNDAKIFFGPPSFEDAKIEVKKGEITNVNIYLK